MPRPARDSGVEGELPLTALAPGQSGEVVCVHPGAPLRQRLLDLGLVPGTRVDVLFCSPLGDPVAYRVRGAVVALRAAVARWVTVRRYS